MAVVEMGLYALPKKYQTGKQFGADQVQSRNMEKVTMMESHPKVYDFMYLQVNVLGL